MWHHVIPRKFLSILLFSLYIYYRNDDYVVLAKDQGFGGCSLIHEWYCCVDWLSHTLQQHEYFSRSYVAGLIIPKLTSLANEKYEYTTNNLHASRIVTVRIIPTLLLCWSGPLTEAQSNMTAKVMLNAMATNSQIMARNTAQR